MADSVFIKAMHPKAEIRPEALAIQKILKAGWVGQLKIHGHRAQIHISADAKKLPIAYNRQGQRHKLPIPPGMVKELRRLFTPETGWNVIDAEWLKPEKKLFVFDVLKLNNKVLRGLTYLERYDLLPRSFLSPHISVLPLLRDQAACLKAMATPGDHIEGLVFKSTTTTGFADSSIVRCRRSKRY